jgi:hypothetical protein
MTDSKEIILRLGLKKIDLALSHDRTIELEDSWRWNRASQIRPRDVELLSATNLQENFPKHLNDIHGGTKCPLLSLHAPLCMLIYVCHTINDDYVSETMIMNFLKYNYRLK